VRGEGLDGRWDVFEAIYTSSTMKPPVYIEMLLVAILSHADAQPVCNGMDV
jgi:hypothetical protein